MSTRHSARLRSVAAEVSRPLAYALLLPSRNRWRRRSTNSPGSAAIPSASSSSTARDPGPTSNAASTAASSAPDRKISSLPRAPSTSCRASIRMDLPAPVSPVSTFRPGTKRTVSSSITATFLIVSSRSILAVGAAGLSLAPLELRAEQIEVVQLGRLDEGDAARRALDGDHVAVSQVHAHLPVNGQVDVLPLRALDDLDHGGVRDDQGPVGQREIGRAHV